MNYNLGMDFGPTASGHPPMPFFDFHTVSFMVAMTYLIQAVVVGFHLRLDSRYHGIRMFLASTLVLAVGSVVYVIQPWVHPAVVGLLSSLFMVWGMALQYGALVKFTDQRPSWWLFWGVTGGATLVLGAMALTREPMPFVAVREGFILPLFVAVALAFRRVDVRTYRFGVLLTALPLAGYAGLSGLRLVRSFIDPTMLEPRPSLTNGVEAIVLFAFSFLWTSGFLLMVNQRLQSDLTALAQIDALTACRNRRAMDKALADEHQRFLRYQRPYSLILIDLDRFKQINDTLGHEAGDRVLVQAAAVFRTGLRTGDTVARWGGEEFLILLPETDVAAGQALAERLRKALEDHDCGIGGRRVTLSAGVAEAAEGMSVKALYTLADHALYRAKETRNRVCVAPGPR